MTEPTVLTEEAKNDIIFMNKLYYNIQKHRIQLFNFIDAKERAGKKISKRTKIAYDSLRANELETEKIIKDIMSYLPIYDEFFCKVKGIGHLLGSSLIAEIQDIHKFPTVTKLWAYGAMTSFSVRAECAKGHKMVMSSDVYVDTNSPEGERQYIKRTCPVRHNKNIEDKEKEVEMVKCGEELKVLERIENKAPSKKKDHVYLFNSRLKMICWKIGDSIIKIGEPYYKDIYYTEKERLRNLNLSIEKGSDKTPLTDMHIHNRAKRKMTKMVLSHLWEAWRHVEGLEVKKPYVVEKLGHTGYMSWQELKSIIESRKNQ